MAKTDEKGHGNGVIVVRHETG